MKKNSDLFSELIVGVFMVAVLVLLAYFTIVISGVELLQGKSRVHVVAHFGDVGGLKERDNVVYRGMKVGSVERIELGADHIVVTALVERNVVLRENCRLTVAALSLLGGNYLLMEEGTGAVKPLEGTVFAGTRPADWMRDLGEVARNLNALTSGGELKSVVTNFEAMAEKLNRLATRIEKGEGTIGKLLSTNEQVYADMVSTVASAKSVVGRLERGEGSLGKLLSRDETVYADLKKTLSQAAEVSGNLVGVSERLAKGEGTLGRLLSKDDRLYVDLKESLADVRRVTRQLAAGEGLFGKITQDKALAEDAQKIVANLKTFSEKLASEQSTLGRLTSDPELYDEVNGLIKDIRQVVDNYRDTTPISSFAGLIGGAL